MEPIDQLLGAADGKRRHDNFATPLVGAVNHIAQLVVVGGFDFVVTAPVGAFHNHHIGMVKGGGVAQNGAAVAADVAAEDEGV